MTPGAFQTRLSNAIFPAATVAFFSLAIFLRDPDRLLRPELWGEDGPVWYAEAYRFGLGSLVIPAGGYLNSLQRLVAIAVQPFPLAWTPFLFQSISVMIQAAPAAFLVSRRMDAAWPHRPSRYLFALLYLLMPNAPETSAGLTNSQWYLAILAFLVVVSSPPKRLVGRLVETLVLVVAGLSGPFCILLVAPALWQALASEAAHRGDAWRRLAVLMGTGLVQAAFVLILSDGRAVGPLGATPDIFVRLFAMISLGAELGYVTLSRLQGTALLPDYIPYIAALGSAGLLAIAIARGPRILAQYCLFAGGVFALALIRPLVSLTDPQWPMLLTPPAGNRYFLFPMIAWWGALFVLAASSSSIVRAVAVILVAVTAVVAIPRDWGDLFALPQTDFVARARAFDTAPPGTTMEFAIQPQGWTFTLTK